MTASQNYASVADLFAYVDRRLAQASVTANSAEIASQIAAQLAACLQKAGGTMTGALTLPSADPGGAYQAVHKTWVQAQIAAGVTTPWTYVDTVTLGSADNALGFTGLDLATDQEYIGRALLKSNTASTTSVRLFVEADTTTTNYRSETENRFTAGTGANTAAIGDLRGSGDSYIVFWIWIDGAGYPRWLSMSTSGGITDVYGMRFTGAYKTVSNVEEFDLDGNVATCFATGSKIDLWKRTV